MEEDNKSLRQRCVDILKTASALEKCRLTRALEEAWRHGEIRELISATDDAIPLRPAREKEEQKRGSVKQNSAKLFLYHLTHAEACAVDCFLDLFARFGEEITEDLLSPEETEQFISELLKIALDETIHFERLNKRLEDFYGTRYGDLSSHDALSSSCEDTQDDLLARLAIVHLVHEARGLDVFPLGRARLTRAQDMDTVKILDLNYADEITHVEKAMNWFKLFANKKHIADPRETFFNIVRDKRRWKLQALKPPFNHAARHKAGFHDDWYLPLVQDVTQQP